MITQAIKHPGILDWKTIDIVDHYDFHHDFDYDNVVESCWKLERVVKLDSRSR
jgi:hypothetical protein